MSYSSLKVSQGFMTCVLLAGCPMPEPPGQEDAASTSVDPTSSTGSSDAGSSSTSGSSTSGSSTSDESTSSTGATTGTTDATSSSSSGDDSSSTGEGTGSSSSTTAENACPPQTFACGDGSCIAASWECDDYVDCLDGSDEYPVNLECIPGATTFETSGFECGPDSFVCTDGSCIPAHWECDIIVDCADGSDEFPVHPTCEESDTTGFETSVTTGDPFECAPDSFVCSDGACIPGGWECDVIVDCEDGSDEFPVHPTCEESEGTTSVSETGAENGGGFSCEEDSFICEDGSCVPADWQCDVVVDCIDGSDEDPSLCG